MYMDDYVLYIKPLIYKTSIEKNKGLHANGKVGDIRLMYIY